MTIELRAFGCELRPREQIAQAVDLVSQLRSFVDQAVKVSPEASLVWAGVCIILPLLSNPSTAEQANRTLRLAMRGGGNSKRYGGFEKFLAYTESGGGDVNGVRVDKTGASSNTRLEAEQRKCASIATLPSMCKELHYPTGWVGELIYAYP